MTKAEKLFQRIKENPKNVSRHDFISVLEKKGFILRSGKGSHLSFRQPEIPDSILILPKDDPVKVSYVRQAIRIIDRIKGDE